MRFFETVYSEKKVKLDMIDKKILFELSQNAREPYTVIAKRVGVSRDTVNYRINNLKKMGVLQGTRTLIDMSKFGYMTIHILLQLKQPTKESENELIKKLKQYPFLRAIIKFNGSYDFELAVVAKSMQECDDIIAKVSQDCAQFLQNYEVLFITKTLAANTFPKSFLDKEQKQELVKHKTLDVDYKDVKILEIVAEQADLPLYEIAGKIKLSSDAVQYRLKKLREQGVIIGYIPAINYSAINYNVYAILLSVLDFSSVYENKLKEFLRTNKDVLWGVKTIGKYNVMLYICTQNPDDLMKTTEQLRNLFVNNIRDYATLINFEEYKYTYFPKGLLS